jgi:glucuronate isomerase
MGQPTPKRPADARQRSAVANGQTLLAGADKNSAEYREYRDVVCDLVEHMGDNVTAVQRAIAEEAAGHIVWCRRARLALLTGDPGFDIGKYNTAANALRRLLADIGQERRLKDVTESHDEFVRRVQREDAAAAAAGAANDMPVVE